MTDLAFAYPNPLDQSLMRPKDHEDRIARLERLLSELSFQHRRNLFDNGECAISQRGVNSANVPTGTSIPDRWQHFRSATSGWTQGQTYDRPSGAGPFIAGVDLTCTTASTPTAGQWTILRQGIEGVRLWPLGFGAPSVGLSTSMAKPLVLSFWVKGNRPGIYTCELLADGSGTQQRITRQFTLQTADVWEYKTLRYPPNPSQVIDYLTTAGMTLHIWLQAGSDFTSGGSINDTWVVTGAGNNNKRAVGNVNLGATVGGYIRFTGLQLEIGTQATPYERLLYSEDLRQCQRYFQTWTEPPMRGVISTGANVSRLGMALPTRMRAFPNLSVVGTLWCHDGIDVRSITNITANYSDEATIEIDATVNAGWTVSGRACGIYQNGAGTLHASAEI